MERRYPEPVFCGKCPEEKVDNCRLKIASQIINEAEGLTSEEKKSKIANLKSQVIDCSIQKHTGRVNVASREPAVIQPAPRNILGRLLMKIS